MQTLSIISIVLYVIFTILSTLKSYELTKIFYGKYTLLVHVMSVVLAIFYFYVIHFYYELYAFNAISTLLALAGGVVSIVYHRRIEKAFNI